MYSYALLDPKDEPWVTFRYHFQRHGGLEKAAPPLPPKCSFSDSKKQLADRKQGSLPSVTDTRSKHSAKAGRRVIVPKAMKTTNEQAGGIIQRPSPAMIKAGTIRTIASSPGPSPSSDPHILGTTRDLATSLKDPSATRTSEDSVATTTRTWLSRTPSPMGSRLFDQPTGATATMMMHTRLTPPPQSVKSRTSEVAILNATRPSTTVPKPASTEEAGRTTPTADDRSAKSGSKTTGRRKPGSSSSSAGLLKSVVAHAMKKREGG